LVTGFGKINKGHYSFVGLVKALSNDSTANILSTPSIVTLDNQEAEIVVGQNVPFRTGSYTNSTTPNPFTTIKREDVGLTLTVTPQINEGNAIQLDISQETSTVTTSVEGGADLITNKRSIKTHVLVDDGGIIVLGGLIEEAVNEKLQKVPFLGDIPWLGALFQYKNLTKSKKNLMVFIHPKILRDAATTTHISHHKYSFLRAQQYHIKSQGIPLLPNNYQPVLDPLDKLFNRLPKRYKEPMLVLPSP
jgi:general secretion pathway protein D